MSKKKITNNYRDRETQTPLQTGGKYRCSGRVSSSCSTCDTRGVTVKRHEHVIWTSCWTPVYVNKYKLHK